MFWIGLLVGAAAGCAATCWASRLIADICPPLDSPWDEGLPGSRGGMAYRDSVKAGGWFVGASLVALALAPAVADAASLRLTWQDNSTNETAFAIERKTGDCAAATAFAEIASVNANVTTYVDNTVVEGLTYCYRVAGRNPAGTGAFSNTASRTVPFSVPAAPSGLTITDGP